MPFNPIRNQVRMAGRAGDYSAIETGSAFFGAQALVESLAASGPAISCEAFRAVTAGRRDSRRAAGS
jgi:hypothetical protein